MRSTLPIILAAASLSACAPFDPEPVSPYQWQLRQERIQRQEEDRLRRCETMDQQSERYARECARTGASQ
jgi:hypothetical protein